MNLQLHGLDRLVYFAPTIFFGYLAAMCAALTLIALLFVTLPNPAALVGAGLFGLMVTLGLFAVLLAAQRRELRYQALATANDAARNYSLILEVAAAAGWHVARVETDVVIELRIASSLLSLGELVVARFDGSTVLIAAISDPRVGYSMAGRRRCRAHVERLRVALLAPDETPPTTPDRKP